MNDKWNAFVDENIVLEPTKKGVLEGLSFAVKDVFALKGYTNRAGNPDWYRTHGPADEHASVVERLLHHGATLKGTLHTDELMYSLNGENVHYGTPVNPIDPQRIPGGSSSGSAVAVSAKLVDFALGTDTGGSVRIPASYCGIYGFRPTHDVVPIDGVIPLAKSFDTVGWMTRDHQLLKDIGDLLIDNQSPEGNFDTIILGEDAWALVDDDVRESLLTYIPSLESISKTCEWQQISQEGLAEWANAFRIIQGLEIWSEHGEWIQQVNPTFGPGIAARFQWTSTLKRSESEQQFQLREKVAKEMLALLGEKGLLVIPTAPGAAPLRNLHGEKAEQYRSKVMKLTCIAGLAGLPQVTIPLENNGLAIGLSFIANRDNDRKLLHWVNKFLNDRTI